MLLQGLSICTWLGCFFLLHNLPIHIYYQITSNMIQFPHYNVVQCSFQDLRVQVAERFSPSYHLYLPITLNSNCLIPTSDSVM